MTDERRPADWPDERLADAFLARAAARPTPPDLAAATLERVRRSSPRSASRPWLYSFEAIAAAAAVVVVVAAVAIGRSAVEPGHSPSTAPGLPVLSVAEAIAIRDADPTDREIAVRGYFSPAPAMRCVPSGFVANPVRLECPDTFQWLVATPRPLGGISSVLPSGRIGFQPVLPFLDTSVLRLAATKAEMDGSLVEVVFIGHFHDRRGHTNLCGTGNDADCDGFVVDGIRSVDDKAVPASTVIDLEPYPQMPRRQPSWTTADVDRLLLAAAPDVEILSRVALPGHRIRELEPALGTGALGVIDRPIAWVVTGLDSGADGSAPVRRTFLLVDGTAEAYETVPWDLEDVGFMPFALVPLPLAPSPSRVTLDLVDAAGRHLSVEIVDDSGLLVSAAAVPPGTPSNVPAPGNDVVVSQVVGQPNEIRLDWVGGACDGPVRFTIRSGGRTIVVEQRPWKGDTDSFCTLAGIPRGITLTFAEPVPAAEVEIVGGAGIQIAPAAGPSNPPSTVVGEPITVSQAIDRRDNRLDDTEIAVRGFAWSPAAVVLCKAVRPVSPAQLHCPDDLTWLAEDPQAASSGAGFHEPVGPAFNLLIRPETYLRSGPLRIEPVEVIVIGHVDDHRAAQCPADQVETCRRNFVVDALFDAARPSLGPKALKDVRPDPSIQTVATEADVGRVAPGALRDAIVLAAFAVSGPAVAGFEPQAAESSELTSAAAVWIVRFVDADVEGRPVLYTKLIIDGPAESLAGSIYVPSPDGLLRETTIID